LQWFIYYFFVGYIKVENSVVFIDVEHEVYYSSKSALQEMNFIEIHNYNDTELWLITNSQDDTHNFQESLQESHYYSDEDKSEYFDKSIRQALT